MKERVHPLLPKENEERGILLYVEIRITSPRRRWRGKGNVIICEDTYNFFGEEIEGNGESGILSYVSLRITFLGRKWKRMRREGKEGDPIIL